MLIQWLSISGPVPVAVPVQEQPFSIGNVLVSRKRQLCIFLFIKFSFSENRFYWFVQVFSIFMKLFNSLSVQFSNEDFVKICRFRG
jgi:hypothetical protein